MKGRVLIVEDDTMIADVLADILETMDLESRWASKGIDAEAAVKKENFDLVILDLELPGIPGTEVARRLRNIIPDIKIIYSTGFSDLEDDIDRDHESFINVIRKPFEIAEIKAAVEKGLRKH
jgi:DNA-binding response OmpR family regulator